MLGPEPSANTSYLKKRTWHFARTHDTAIGLAAVKEFSYSVRPGVFAPERRYVLGAEHLEWTGAGSRRVAYRDIDDIAVFQTRFWGSARKYWSCVLRLRTGKKIRLSAAHRAGLHAIEDRTPVYIPFIKELEARIKAANTKARFVLARSWLSRVEIVLAGIAIKLLGTLRHVDRNVSADTAAWLMRKIGPWLRGHRTARMQLALAFPEKSAESINHILTGMWDNLGRVAAEFAHLDRITIGDPERPDSGDVMYDSTALLQLDHIRQDGKPIVFFAAHLANWEIPALVPPQVGLDSYVLYRRPDYGAISDAVVNIRGGIMGTLVPADLDAPIRLANALKKGGHVGMLVDQHYARGVEVTFFGRSCKVSPLLAQLARRFDCPIRGLRVVRLRDRNKFWGELTESLDPPRDADSRIDIQRTMQAITSVVESWVREYPDQWLWLHRRWR